MIDVPGASPLASRWVAQNENFYIWRRVAFHIFFVGNRRHIKFGMWVEHSKSQPQVTNRPCNGGGHVTSPILNCWFP